MIRLLRHDPSIPREDDGSVRFDDIMEEFKAKSDGTSQWPIIDWITFPARFMQRNWSFLRPGSEKKRYGIHVCKPDGQWDDVAENMMINFAKIGHPIFRASSFRNRLIEKQRERNEIHSLQRYR